MCQYLEYGFPLGLQEDYILKPILKNHSSAYEYYSHVDKCIKTKLQEGGMTGPFKTLPFEDIMVSPLMTSHKNQAQEGQLLMPASQISL